MRWVWISFCSVLVLISATFRIQTAVWQQRITSRLAVMRSLKVGETELAEVRRRLPEFATEPCRHCQEGNCYCAADQNWATTVYTATGRMPSTLSRLIYRAAYLLGARPALWYAETEFRNGTIRSFSYQFFTGAPDAAPIKVRVGTSTFHSVEPLAPVRDESPDYRLYTYFKWPDHELEIGLGRGAEPQALDHAFSPDLSCTWGLRGCRNVQQLMPEAMNDKFVIEQRVYARLRSANPCPDRILWRRAVYVPTIYLVEVERVRPVSRRHPDELLVDYKLIKVLKNGTVQRPLAAMRHPAHVAYYLDGMSMATPAAGLLIPGQRFIMFAAEHRRFADLVYTPCEIMLATPTALRTLDAALAAGR